MTGLYGYIRTSRDELNTENQRLMLTDAGVAPNLIYTDAGVSGRAGVSTRNGWRNLMADIREGDTLVVVEVSRIGRMGGPTVTAIVNDLQERGIGFRSLRQSYLDVLKPRAEQSRMEKFVADTILRLMGDVAAEELDLLVTRTKAGIERARAEGKQIGQKKALSSELEDMLHLDAQIAGNDANWSALGRKYGVSRATARRIGTRISVSAHDAP